MSNQFMVYGKPRTMTSLNAMLNAVVIAVIGTPALAQNVKYLLTGDGGRVSWSQTNQLLAVDRADAKGFFRIWTMDKDGKNLKCLSCANPALPKEHQGNPAWHPSGKFIVFQATDPTVAHKGMAKTMVYKLYTCPGAGTNNNIWIMSNDGKRVWQITKLKKGEGVLHPHFSPDGTKLVWAQRLNGEQGIGRWVIKLADFQERRGEPAVSSVATLTPGDLLWYETHGFSPDGQLLIYSGMPSHGQCCDFDIYTYSLKTREVKCLTDPNLKQWDEHAHFTPDGKRIVWMSSQGFPQPPNRLNQFLLKTDFWIMNADGTDKKQLTFFNDPNGRLKRKRVIASDLTMAGDGSCIYGYIQDPGTVQEPGSVVRIELPRGK